MAIQHDGNADEWDMEQIARALVEAETRGIERAAKWHDEREALVIDAKKRSWDGEVAVYHIIWGIHKGSAASIRKLKETE